MPKAFDNSFLDPDNWITKTERYIYYNKFEIGFYKQLYVACKPKVESSTLSGDINFSFLTLIITLKFFVLKEKHYYFYFMCVL